jgi:excisionase family DNA binding protein
MEDNHFQLIPEVAKRLGLGPYLSMTETAELLGCTTRTIRQMVADGRLRAHRLGPKFVRLRSDEVLAALQPYGGAA